MYNIRYRWCVSVRGLYKIIYNVFDRPPGFYFLKNGSTFIFNLKLEPERYYSSRIIRSCNIGTRGLQTRAKYFKFVGIEK